MVPSSKSNKDNSIKNGLSWIVSGHIANLVISTLLSVLLARLLEPGDYGLVAMVMIFTGYANLLINFGFGAALIQKKHLSEKDSSSVFWLSFLIGLILSIIIFLLSDVLANFYNEPRLIDITKVISVVYIFSSLNTVPNAILTRDLKFKTISSRNVLSSLISGVLAITLAINGFSYWSLVFQSVSNTLIGLMFIWISSKWIPKKIFSFDSIKELSKFSISLFSINSLGYVTKNLDNFLVGKFIGKAQLGLYSKSFSFITIPNKTITQTLVKFFFPYFSRIQDDEKKIGELYLEIQSVVFFIMLPILSIVSTSSDEFTIVIFGAKWLGLSPLIKIFCYMSMASILNRVASSIFMSKGRSRLIWQMGGIHSFIIIMLIVFGFYWGLIGVAILRTIAEFINLIITFYYINKTLIEVTMKKQVLNLMPYLVSVSFLIVGLYLIKKPLLTFTSSSLVVLITNIIVGGVIYLVSIAIIDKNIYKRFISYIR